MENRTIHFKDFSERMGRCNLDSATGLKMWDFLHKISNNRYLVEEVNELFNIIYSRNGISLDSINVEIVLYEGIDFELN